MKANRKRLVNSVLVAQKYQEMFGETISDRYVRALLNPYDKKRKNQEQIERVKAAARSILIEMLAA